MILLMQNLKERDAGRRVEELMTQLSMSNVELSRVTIEHEQCGVRMRAAEEQSARFRDEKLSLEQTRARLEIELDSIRRKFSAAKEEIGASPQKDINCIFASCSRSFLLFRPQSPQHSKQSTQNPGICSRFSISALSRTVELGYSRTAVTSLILVSTLWHLLNAEYMSLFTREPK